MSQSSNHYNDQNSYNSNPIFSDFEDPFNSTSLPYIFKNPQPRPPVPELSDATALRLAMLAAYEVLTQDPEIDADIKLRHAELIIRTALGFPEPPNSAMLV